MANRRYSDTRAEAAIMRAAGRWSVCQEAETLGEMPGRPAAALVVLARRAIRLLPGNSLARTASHNLALDRCCELYRSLADSMRAAGGSAGSIIEAAVPGRSSSSGRTIRSTNNTR